MKNKTNLLSYSLMAIRCILVVILLVVMISTQLSGKVSKASVDEISKKIVSSINVGDKMEKSSNRMFKKMYGLNAGDYDELIFYKPATGMAAQEMLLIKLKNIAQSEEVVTAIEERLSSQKNSFEGYGVEQSALLDKAIIDARGNFVFYIVHEQASDADHVFRNSL